METAQRPTFTHEYIYDNYKIYLADGIKHMDDLEITSKGNNVSFFLCTSGSIAFKLNDKEIKINKGDLFYVGSPMRFVLKKMSSNFNTYIISISCRFSSKDLYHKALPLTDTFTIIRTHPCFHFEPECAEYFNLLYTIIAKVITGSRDQFTDDILYHHIAAFGMWLSGFITRQTGIEPIQLKYSDIQFRKFTELIIDNLQQHHDLQFYADKLCITAKHLSNITRKAVNVSGNKWITNIVVHKAKSLLRTTPKTITQVAREVGFDDTSNFSKYFRKEAGVTPTKFRSL